MNDDKRKNIIKTLQETKQKRKTQRCLVFELKIDEYKLNKKQKEILKMFFIESKWLYNYYLSTDDIFNQSDKINKVIIKDRDKNDIEKELKYLPAKVKQSILKQLKQNIYNLSKAKKKNKVGSLKFKSEYNSIELNQYGNTHKIIGNKLFKIAGIKKYIYVHGLNQIKPEYEIANARLIRKASGYYIKLTCFKNLKDKDLNFIKNKKGDIGVDFGIKDNIITSEGEFFNIKIQEDEHLKKLQRKLARQKKGSKNFYKTVQKIKRCYENIYNKKQDQVNKLVNYLCTTYTTVYMQDENLKGWHSGWFGKQVQCSALGSLKQKLSRQKNVIMIDRFEPTTKLCYKCGAINRSIKLSDRIFKCECGYEEQRDIKSAKTIMFIGRLKNNYIPTDCREFKLVEKKTSGNSEFFENLSYTSVKQEAHDFSRG